MGLRRVRLKNTSLDDAVHETNEHPTRFGYCSGRILQPDVNS